MVCVTVMCHNSALTVAIVIKKHLLNKWNVISNTTLHDKHPLKKNVSDNVEYWVNEKKLWECRFDEGV